VVDVVRRHRPAFFILENVKRLLSMERGVHFATILASLAELDYRIEWRLLNAADFGLPQNRQRVFVVGVRIGENRRGSDHAVRLANPKDFTGTTLRAGLLRSPESWPEITSHGDKWTNWGLARAGRYYGVDLGTFSEAKECGRLDSILQGDAAPEFDFTESTVERLTASKHVKRFVQGVEILSNQGGGARMGYTVFGTGGLAPTLTSSASRHYERYKIGERYRRLTNVEYARLQGFPDDHCSAVSVYDQYALFGNAVPSPMAAWVMKRTSSRGVSAQSLPRTRQQQRLFADV
jgi:DNA (cytosine-5)-methyltransferase 1